jgi:hypothetical protein
MGQISLLEAEQVKKKYSAFTEPCTEERATGSNYERLLLIQTSSSVSICLQSTFHLHPVYTSISL